MKITKKLLGQLGIRNPHDLCSEAGGKLYIGYRSGDSRSRISPAWVVHGMGFRTDPKAHWMDYGNKTFRVFGKSKLEHVSDAKAWVAEQYGITEWERDVFGAWQAAETIERMRELLRKANPPKGKS